MYAKFQWLWVFWRTDRKWWYAQTKACRQSFWKKLNNNGNNKKSPENTLTKQISELPNCMVLNATDAPNSSGSKTMVNANKFRITAHGIIGLITLRNWLRILNYIQFNECHTESEVTHWMRAVGPAIVYSALSFIHSHCDGWFVWSHFASSPVFCSRQFIL